MSCATALSFTACRVLCTDWVVNGQATTMASSGNSASCWVKASTAGRMTCERAASSVPSWVGVSVSRIGASCSETAVSLATTLNKGAGRAGRPSVLSKALVSATI